jgi:hypothetical protein
MLGFLWRLRDLLRLFLSGHARKMWDGVRYRLYSESTSLGMRRDLGVAFKAPTATIPIRIRPLAPTDDLTILDPDQPGISADEASWRLGQWRLLCARMPTCYVAVDAEDRICYMQWLLADTQNSRIRTVFGNLYPMLRPEEMLLEGAYTPEQFRGKGIMGAAMARVAERALEFGARRVITFVDESSVASVKGCRKAGFTPFVRRRETFRLFRRRITFLPLTGPVAVPDVQAALTS